MGDTNKTSAWSGRAAADHSLTACASAHPLGVSLGSTSSVKPESLSSSRQRAMAPRTRASAFEVRRIPGEAIVTLSDIVVALQSAVTHVH